MSNDERHRLSAAVQDDTQLWAGLPDTETRRVLYKAGPQVIRDRVLLEWANENEDDWRPLYDAAGAYKRPTMPVTGEHLIAAGLAEGPSIGEALRKLEAAWIASDFQPGKDDLLKLL
jgi:poly(A) polymerase